MERHTIDGKRRSGLDRRGRRHGRYCHLSRRDGSWKQLLYVFFVSHTRADKNMLVALVNYCQNIKKTFFREKRLKFNEKARNFIRFAFFWLLAMMMQ